MAYIAAAVAAVAAGGSAYYKHKSEAKRAKRAQKALRQRISRQQGIGGTAFDQQEAAVKRAAEKRLGGLSTAEKDIGRALRERESVARGQTSQALSRSGLGSTSIGVNANRAVTQDTSRQMSDLLSQLAQSRGNIESERELALGDLSRQRGDLQQGLAQDATQGVQDLAYSGPSYGEDAFGAFGAGLGAYVGAGGGFGGGGQQAQQQGMLDQIYRGGFGQGRGYLQNRGYGQFNRGNANYGLGGQYTSPSFGGYY